MNNCKKHQACQFKGEGEHEGCYMHGVIDECTNEYQQLFKEHKLGYATAALVPPLTEKEKKLEQQRRHELEVARVARGSDSGGSWFFGGLIIGMMIIYLILK